MEQFSFYANDDWCHDNARVPGIAAGAVIVGCDVKADLCEADDLFEADDDADVGVVDCDVVDDAEGDANCEAANGDANGDAKGDVTGDASGIIMEGVEGIVFGVLGRGDEMEISNGEGNGGWIAREERSNDEGVLIFGGSSSTKAAAGVLIFGKSPSTKAAAAISI